MRNVLDDLAFKEAGRAAVKLLNDAAALCQLHRTDVADRIRHIAKEVSGWELETGIEGVKEQMEKRQQK